jgi:F-type H+-transporting ATPase subunit b
MAGDKKMTRPISRHLRRTGWTFLGICVISCGFALGQEQRSGASASASPASEQHAQQSNDDRQHFGRELARNSREAAGEDENAQFKQSASVQKIAAITGLSLQHAYWLCLMVNFAVVAGLIFWVSRKNLPALFRTRTAQIQQAMEEARRASAEANQRLADIAARLSRLDAEIAEMRAAAETDAVSEEARIKAAAEEDARKIFQAAQQEIAAAAKIARRELKAYAASLAVSLAAKQIRVDPAADQALVRDFAAQLADDGKSQRGDN